MKDLEYTYAVARIRALEVSLLDKAAIEQLLACGTYEQCLQFLSEKGWGDAGSEADGAALLKKEEEKTWKVITEVAPDMGVFDVLSYPKLYHNLKAAVKEVCTEIDNENIFYEDCKIPGKEMLQLVKNKEFDKLPGNMPQAAREAYDTLLHTKDGQLCDVIVDRAALDAIYEAGQKSGDGIIRQYADSTVAIADIKIAVRAAKTLKSAEFMRRSMAECGSINREQLIKAALSGMDAIQDYLAGTSYAGGVEALEESASAFERWCDNRMIETMRSQKYETFSVGPLVAYLVARENEIKTVRIILTGKQNDFPEESIRERVREMYV